MLCSHAMADSVVDTSIYQVYVDSLSPETFDVSGITTSSDFSYTIELNEAGITLLKDYVGSNKSTVGAPTFVSMVGSNTAQKFAIGMGYSSNSAGDIQKAAPFMAICDAGSGKTTSGYRLAGDSNNYWMGQNADAMTALATVQGVSLTLTANMSSNQGATLYTTIAYTVEGSDTLYYSVIPGVASSSATNMHDGGLRWSGFAMNDLQINKDYIDTVLVYDYTLSAEQALESNQAIFSVSPVPEPATGTLSLLALAGLCARRRRK